MIFAAVVLGLIVAGLVAETVLGRMLDFKNIEDRKL